MTCPNCGSQMSLVETYFGKYDIEVHVYQCPKCQTRDEMTIGEAKAKGEVK